MAHTLVPDQDACAVTVGDVTANAQCLRERGRLGDVVATVVRTLAGLGSTLRRLSISRVLKTSHWYGEGCDQLTDIYCRIRP